MEHSHPQSPLESQWKREQPRILEGWLDTGLYSWQCLCGEGGRCKWILSLSVEWSFQTFFYWSVAPPAVTSNLSHTRRWKSGACLAFELFFVLNWLGAFEVAETFSIFFALSPWTLGQVKISVSFLLHWPISPCLHIFLLCLAYRVSVLRRSAWRYNRLIRKKNMSIEEYVVPSPGRTVVRPSCGRGERRDHRTVSVCMCPPEFMHFIQGRDPIGGWCFILHVISAHWTVCFP